MTKPDPYNLKDACWYHNTEREKTWGGAVGFEDTAAVKEKNLHPLGSILTKLKDGGVISKIPRFSIYTDQPRGILHAHTETVRFMPDDDWQNMEGALAAAGVKVYNSLTEAQEALQGQYSKDFSEVGHRRSALPPLG